jgi:hypothetical protein
MVISEGNFGWNVMEGDECYDDDSCNMRGKIDPAYVYSHDSENLVNGERIIGGANSFVPFMSNFS